MTTARTELAVRTQAAAQLYTVAWLAAGLGFALALLASLGSAAIEGGTALQGLLAGAAQRVAWSTIVCVGLAAAKSFAPASPGASAWAGMVAAPLALFVSRTAGSGFAQAVGLVEWPPAPVAFLVLLATIAALEYGVLGAWLARHDARGEATLRRYAWTGLGVGAGFAPLALGVAAWLAWPPAAPAAWLARGVDEVLFPLGCALVLYAASLAARRAPAT